MSWKITWSIDSEIIELVAVHRSLAKKGNTNVCTSNSQKIIKEDNKIHRSIYVDEAENYKTVVTFQRTRGITLYASITRFVLGTQTIK